MPCALEVIDTRLQSTSHIQCNRSFDRNIGCHFSKGHLIRKPVSVHPEDRDTALTVCPLGHDSDWKPASLLSEIQEVNKLSSLTSGAPGTEGFELSSAQPRILCCLGQPNERNMHDQAASSKSVSTGNPHGGSTLRQPRHRKNVCNSSTAVAPCHVVAKKYSRPITATLRSDSNILHDDGKPPKRSPRKKGNKKDKPYKRTSPKKLNLASEITFVENTYGVSPVEVLPTTLPVDKLSETTSSASSLVKETHLGKNDGENNNDYVECGTVVNLSTLEIDEMDGSECAGSSNDAAGWRLSCSCVPYLNDESNTSDSSEFDGCTFTEHGLGEESNSYQKLPRACVYNPGGATTDSFFSRWNNENSGNYSTDAEARLTIKDANRHDHSQPGPSTGLNNVRMECHLIGSHLSATHAEDTNDPFGSRSCSPKDVTDSFSHNERVQCSSEACSSKTSLQFSSGRRNRRPRKTPSYSVSNRVVSANRHKNNGKDGSAVWQKVQKNDKIISKAGHSSSSSIQDKSASEDSNKGVQQDPTRHREKHNHNKKVCKQESSNGTADLESIKEEEEALNSCQTFSRPIYKKQVPFLRQQRNSSSKQGSQSSINYYAPRNNIPKMPTDYLQQEELPMLQLVHAKDTSDRSTLIFCSADEVVLTGVGSNFPTKGNESSQSDIEMDASVSFNLVPDFAPQAASNEAHITHSLCPENKGTSTSWSSKNLYTDPCAAEMEEPRCVKLTTENNPQESCKLYSAAGLLSQRWVPVGKKQASNVIHVDVSEASIAEGSVPANDISDSVGPVSTNVGDRKLASQMTSKPNSFEHVDLTWQADIGTETGYSKIKEAIGYVYTAQQRVEDIQLRIGRPLADFEQFIYSAAPAVHRSPCLAGCKSYLQERVKDGLCLHQTPDISLRSVWQWYEEPGCYGLEVKAQDFRRSKGLWNSHCQFTTYFVPYLSAVQLFSHPKRTNSGSIDKEAIHMDMTCETSPYLNLPPIFAKLLPQQSNLRKGSSTIRTEDDEQSANGELIFEYFESEQPYLRRQLFDRVNELIAGVKPSSCQISGDPKNLELSLHDLHPASWYCVAWYPIYRIPDGKFQAAFLTYHSLGHWVHRSSPADLDGDAPVVLPVIGLLSYKAVGWFQMSRSEREDGEAAESQCSEASQVVKEERLRTLNEAAAVMSRANVRLKGEQTSRNRHPDYEFFVSRY